MTDDIAKRARDEAERLLPCTCIGGHFPKCQQQQTAAVAARIAQSLSYESELVTAGTELGREIAELKGQLADAQREIGLQKNRALVAEATVAQGWSDRYADAQRERDAARGEAANLYLRLNNVVECDLRMTRADLVDARREIERLKASKPWLHRWEDTKERRALMDENAALRRDIEELNQEVLDERALTQKIAEGLDPDKGGDEPYRLLIEIEKQNAALREENERLKNLDYLGAHKDALAIAQREIERLKDALEQRAFSPLTNLEAENAALHEENLRLNNVINETRTDDQVREENARLKADLKSWTDQEDMPTEYYRIGRETAERLLRDRETENAALRRALDNCLALARAKQRRPERVGSWEDIVRYCADAGVVPQITRAALE